MYTPLEFCKYMNVQEISPKLKMRKIVEDVLRVPDDAIRFLKWDDSFLDVSYQGEFKEVNDYLINHRRKLYEQMFHDSGNFADGSDADKEAAADCLIPYLLVNLWSRNKQVYTFDPELEFTLSDMDEVEMPVRILDKLPYRTFYIEFAENGIYRSHFHGVFVHFIKHGVGYLMHLMRITEDGKSMTGATSFVPESKEQDAKFLINRFTDVSSSNTGCAVDWSEFCMFLLNAILYLCSENAEIRENEVTKKTYRPAKIVRNKFSEIRKQECGYVYGEKIRMSKLEKSQPLQLGNTTPTKHNIRRHTVRPHTRKAHWHHYWVGKGRTELILRWIAPVSVGTGDVITTIHECIP